MNRVVSYFAIVIAALLTAGTQAQAYVRPNEDNSNVPFCCNHPCWGSGNWDCPSNYNLGSFSGRTGIRRMLLGSVASAVVTYAHCRVMIVK